ncbi:MAG: P1 family peptidase [Ignavibacteriae bacterium]|nr:P1 family peptidase [Ignavibacteriota bacterium]
MKLRISFTLVIIALITTLCLAQEIRPRARDIGLEIGIFKPGKLNAITDVAGVRVGHATLIEQDSIRTGVTAVVPHEGNIFKEKVPAAVVVGNGFGKLVGSTQVEELGQLETPIVLTNTLSVWTAADAVVDYMLSLSGNERLRSINPVVGETNDGTLNDIRGKHVKKEHALEALRDAKPGPVEEGSIGAGTGTVCFGWKGGIGTSSRILPPSLGGYTIGVLVQTNYGGILEIAGAPVGKELGKFPWQDELNYGDGSCMIIVATDAPLRSDELKRLAKRALLALGRTGSSMSHGSGDYVIAFSTAKEVRTFTDSIGLQKQSILRQEQLSPLFQTVVEATEEAIYNSLFKATTVTGRNGTAVEAISIEKVKAILKKYNKIK